MKQAIQQVLQDFSIEVTPNSWQKEQQYLSLLPASSRIFVTFLPQQALQATLDTCFAIQKHGRTAVPHLAARNLEQRSELETFCRAVQDLAGEALFLAGARKQPAGIYPDSLSLLREEVVQRSAWQYLYFAGHPEGAPDIPEPVRIAAEEEKFQWLDKKNLNGGLLTQFCFEPSMLLAWAKGLKGEVTVGLAGCASITALIKYAQQCGVSMSLRFLMQKRSKILNLFRAYDPSPMIYALAQAKKAGELTHLKRLHFFPFGTFKETLLWLQKVQNGDFEVTENGFVVH